MKQPTLKWTILASVLCCVPASSRLEAPPQTPSSIVGAGEFVDYTRYGNFVRAGTTKYRYVVKDRAGLSKAVGAAIYPNSSGLYQDSEFRKLLREKKLEGPLEQFRPDLDPKIAFYKWASMRGTPFQGLRMTNIGQSLELLGQPRRALDAYYAVVVHFPKEIAWQSNRPWYVGVSALDSIHRLLEAHPEWKLSLNGASIDIQNGFDRKATNDVFKINPGKWTVGSSAAPAPDVGAIKRWRFKGQVGLAQYDNGHWQLMVDGKPYLIRGICYSPTPVGRSPDLDGYKPHSDWMVADLNENGQSDGPYDSFVDENGNNARDKNEPVVGDFELIRRMGANTLRLYHQAVNKALLRDLSGQYGIRVLMGDLLGSYAVGSGADWDTGTNYSDLAQRELMRRNVRRMVLEHKDESYVLMWVLGNENNYGHGNNADKDPETYYRFVNTIARMIHATDPNHPVALCNGELENLDMIARLCPDVDVLAVNAYRGAAGFGESFWKNTADIWKKPVLISEFGAPAFNTLQTLSDAAQTQASYLLSNWADIASHGAGQKSGNAIGGCLFEWMDEWWKSGSHYEAWVHDEVPQDRGPFVGGFMYEEWLGIASQGKGEKSPYLRQLRPAYFGFQKGPWKEPMNFKIEPKSAWKGSNPVEFAN